MKITAAVLFGSFVVLAAPAQAAVIYNLQATNISTDILPSTLFSNTVTGYIEVPDNLMPGDNVNLSNATGAFNIGGYQFTLTDFTSGSDFNGYISADGQSISFLSSGYQLKDSVPGCDSMNSGFYGCYGSFDIAQSQPSNLLVFDTDQLGGIEFDTAFVRAVTAVPEPLTLSLFGVGLAGAAAMRRRRNKNKA